MTEISKTFCALPWLHSFVNIEGQIQVCCTSEEFHRGIERPEGGIFNIADGATQDEVMNSPFMREIRKELLAGKFPRLCTRCVITEQLGGTSRRITENNKMSELVDLAKLAAQTDADGRISVEIRNADYRLGNACNLQCRMCHPGSSVAWLKEWNEVKLPNEQVDDQLRQTYTNIDWINHDVLMEDLRQKVPFLDFLHFAGGEPLFAPRMADMLEICVASGRADKIILTYNTNMTRVPPKVKALWKNFKEVRLYCSLDGHGLVNDYIRANSKWQTIDDNLRMLDAEAKELHITHMIFSATVQAYNILNLDALFDYAATFTHMPSAVNLINLYRPEYLQSTILPPAAKNLARQRLLAVKEKFRPKLNIHDLYLLDGIDEAINFMMANDHSELIPRFWDFNTRMDRKKGVSLAEHIPELAEYMPCP